VVVGSFSSRLAAVEIDTGLNIFFIRHVGHVLNLTSERALSGWKA
jgi:hypothetical protein